MPEDLAPHREAALAGTCPFCGLGGWGSLAQHVARKHGVRSRELKRRLGLPYSASLTSPEVHARQSEIRTEHGVSPALVEAGRTSSRALHIGPAGTRTRLDASRRNGRAHAERTRKIPAADLPTLSARVEQGERYRDIAAEYGASAPALFRLVKKWRQGRTL